MTVRLSPGIEMSPATWQRRTLRYLAIYLVLALTLVGLRYKTQHVRPDLLAAQQQEGELLTQRDNLEIAVQVAVTPQKVQAWAMSNGMIHFAESSKTARDLGPAAAPVTPSTDTDTIEVKTQWK